MLTHAVEYANVSRETEFAAIALRGKHTVIVGTAARLQLPYFGSLTLAGSGAPALQGFLHERAFQYEQEFANDSQFIAGMRVAHYLPMQLLSANRFNPSITLSNGVGGFYEVWFIFDRGLEEDDMGWVRILADSRPPFNKGVTLRGLWWHVYDWQ